MSDAARGALELAFRRLSPQLVAALGRRVGPGRLDLAEDAVQYAMLQAARTWVFHGTPDQPRAWLLRVASNRLTDLLQLQARETPSEEAGSEEVGPVGPAPEPPSFAFAAELPDDELRLLFACCHPALSEEMQVTLTLKVACGFSVREIALALLADEPAVAQRLVRAKRTLREKCASLEVPGPEELPPRLSAVHHALYLLFNEGYEASGGEDLSRVELCEEALRLVELLLSHARTETHEGHALAALLCFRAARLAGRVDAEGTFVPQAARGPEPVSPTLVARGEHHLRTSMGDSLTPAHLEAEIAWLHARARRQRPWTGRGCWRSTMRCSRSSLRPSWRSAAWWRSAGHVGRLRRSRPSGPFARSRRWSATRGASRWRVSCESSSVSGCAPPTASGRPRRWPELLRSASTCWPGRGSSPDADFQAGQGDVHRAFQTVASAVQARTCGRLLPWLLPARAAGDPASTLPSPLRRTVIRTPRLLPRATHSHVQHAHPAWGPGPL
ncbi:RNA polymerase sigma factor [Pyxidicoccus sp. 3LG]